MKKVLLGLGLLVVFGTAALAADETPPQLFLNLDGAGGMQTEPTAQAGHGIGGGGIGFEFIPVFLPELGLNVDYVYQAVGNGEQDNDMDLSLRGFGPHWGPVTGWLQGGIGFNTSPNLVNGGYLAFVEPGVRWTVLPRLAVDAGIQYQVDTPKSAFVQSFGVTLGLSIPLDADYAGFSKAKTAGNHEVQSPARHSTATEPSTADPTDTDSDGTTE